MREAVTGEEAGEETLTLTITGRTGSWLVSGVLGDEELPLQGVDDHALQEMLHAMLPSPPTVAGPPVQRRGRHRRAG